MMRREDKAVLLEEQLKKEERIKHSHKVLKVAMKIFLLLMAIFILFTLYMHFVGTKGLVVREYKIESDKLPDNFNGFKIVHFTDLHYLTTINKKELNTLINKINKLKPDIVVFTGDLVDDNKEATDSDLQELITSLNKIEVTTELYAIKGNHDYHNDYFEKVFNETRFKILNNSYDYIYYKGVTPIIIAGTGSSIQDDSEIETVYQDLAGIDLYTISLFHEPDMIDSILSYSSVDLALAGHSHNGQIRFPGIGAVMKIRGGKKYPNYSYKINDTNLYVSGGLGTSMYEFRLFNHPSINFYRLVTK